MVKAVCNKTRKLRDEIFVFKVTHTGFVADVTTRLGVESAEFSFTCFIGVYSVVEQSAVMAVFSKTICHKLFVDDLIRQCRETPLLVTDMVAKTDFSCVKNRWMDSQI